MPQEFASDAQLIRRHLDGDASAFEALADRHAPMVYRASLRLLGDAHEAEDATQAVFVILARKAMRFRKGGDLAAWLHGIARRVASEARRSKARRRRREEEGAMLKAASAGSEPPAAEKAAALEVLDREVGALPSKERQAVVLRYLEGHSVEEAAKIAACPEGTLGRRAHDGLARLRSRLGGRGAMLGTAALVAVLEAELAGATPASLVPSVMTASQAAATGATFGAGAVGAKAIMLAEGTMKAMLLFKVKIAAAVLGATLVAGAAVPVTQGLVRAGERKGPGVAAKPAGVKKTAGEWGKAANGLRMSLRSDKAAYAKGEPITLTLAFENVSKTPRRLHAYMLNYWHLKWNFEGDVKQSQKNIRFRLARPTEKQFPVLKAGGKTSFTFKLAGNPPSFRHAPVMTTTSLAGTGEYRIQVTYENQRDAKVQGRELDKVWKGSLTSNKAAFTIGNAKTAWGKEVNGLQAGLVPLSGSEKWVWNQRWGAYRCPSRKCALRLRAKKAGVCSECGNVRAGARKFCPSCATKKRVCEACGEPAPAPSATFAEGKPMRFELHFRNTSGNELRLWGGLRWPDRWQMVFIPKAGGVPRGLRYRGPMPKRAQPADIKLPKGAQIAVVTTLGKAFQFDHHSAGPRDATAAPIAHLRAGKYTAQAIFEWKFGEQWKGKVLTAPVEIEIKAGGEADRSAQIALAAARKTFGGRKLRMPDGKEVEPKITVAPYAEGAAGRLAEFWPGARFYRVERSTPVVRTRTGGWGGTGIAGAVAVSGEKAEVLRFQSNDFKEFFGRGVAHPVTKDRAEAAARAFWALTSGNAANEKSTVTGDKSGWKVKLSVQNSPATIWINPPEAGKKGCRVKWQRLSPSLRRPPPPPPGR